MRIIYEDKKVHLEISHSVGSVAFLSHVPVHVLEPVDPALKLDEVRSMGLHSQVDSGLSLGHEVKIKIIVLKVMAYLVYHDGEPVLCQRRNITENAGPEQGMTGIMENYGFEIKTMNNELLLSKRT